MNTKFTKQYFIDKLSAIPEDQWITGMMIDDKNRCCVLGHCGSRHSGCKIIHTAESLALIKILTKCEDGKEHYYASNVWFINDGYTEHKTTTPKKRILDALNTLPN